MRLIVTHGPNEGHEYLLPGDESTIGRSTSNSIALPSPEISRRHARIWQVEESTYLEDLGSTNGTFVNDARLTKPVALYDGDEIRIGDSFRLLVASPEGVTRPISVPPIPEAQPAAAVYTSPGYSKAGPASEIPTPRPPLYTGLDEQSSSSQEPGVDQGANYLRWLGLAGLVIVSLCFLALLFLDSYQEGQLLYCGSLNPFFESLLGPFGFNPICP